ncbi:ATP-binding protein [Spiroplasma endosymbiont of Aspidapion aeneum]|uniref:ATP-binding protein n=1 Tax=Spiroplasma endosymbiont of Aspidapion aeneum TaxID=3066276 RepID=UPI00313AD873
MNKNDEFNIHYDPRTYKDYTSLRNVNTKHFLMLAELIDNSISSFENHYGDEWPEKLKIDIEIDFNGDIETIHDYKVVSNASIKVTDNAFGMNESELIEAIKLNRVNNKNISLKKSLMNVHGRGLKQCAFFFGLDLTVSTYNGTDEPLIVKIKSSEQETLENPITIYPNHSGSSKRGTTILIEKIHNDKILSQQTIKQIIDTLSFRYIKYLIEENIEINFRYLHNESEIYRKFEVPIEPKQHVVGIFSKSELNRQNYDNFVNEANENFKKRILKEGDKINSSTSRIVFDKIKDLLKKSFDENQIVFDFGISVNIDGKPLDFNFWMLPQKDAQYRGIRLFEGKRAINHCGYKDLETKPYMGWKNSEMETGSTENRFAGECNLAQIGLLTKTDKSTFTMSDNVKADLDKEIYSVWIAFNTFIMKTRDFIKTKTPEIKDKDRDDLMIVFKQKFPDDDIKILGIDNENKRVNIKYSKYGGWDIYIKDDNSLVPFDIFNTERRKSEKIIDITVYTSHPFFKKINNSKEWYIEALIPITLLVAIQYIEWIENPETDPFSGANKVGELFENENNKD